jgi:hypothetical protein
VILKMVNSGSSPVSTSININGPRISQYAKVITLSGTASQRNSLNSPDLIVPEENTVPVFNSFIYTLPGNSLQVFRIKTDSIWQNLEETGTKKKVSQLVIVPNPVSDHARIFFDNSLQEECTLCLYDSAGRQIFSKTGIRENSAEINRGSLPSGIYLVELKAPGKVFREKMIILRN